MLSLSLATALISVSAVSGDNWDSWWTYEGISGPEYWGVLNQEWTMCNKGRSQSPVNINPGSIIFDSTLTQLTFNKHVVSAVMSNTGQSVVVAVSDSEPPVHLSGGPLLYTYTFSQIIFHWASRGTQDGSEHSVNHHSFPAELQIYGYNSDLYPNMTVAREHVRGVVAVSLMVQVKEARPEQDHSRQHSGLGALISRLSNIQFSGQETNVPRLGLADIIPSTGEFITYEGSTTFPGCWETVTWIIMNKPVYISQQELQLFQQLSQGDDSGTGKQPGVWNNLRPRQNLNRRIVRTNIDLKYEGDCNVDTSSERQFQANNWLHHHIADTANMDQQTDPSWNNLF